MNINKQQIKWAQVQRACRVAEAETQVIKRIRAIGGKMKVDEDTNDICVRIPGSRMMRISYRGWRAVCDEASDNDITQVGKSYLRVAMKVGRL